MKSLEFNTEDLQNEVNSLRTQVQELKSLADSRAVELARAADRLQQDEQAQQTVERLRKKGEVDRQVIAQLKKELEKQAFRVMQMEQIMQREEYEVGVCTIPEEEEDGWN